MRHDGRWSRRPSGSSPPTLGDCRRVRLWLGEFRVCCTEPRPVLDETYLAWLLTLDAAIHPEYHAEYGRAVPETDDCRDMVRKIVAAQIEALEQEGGRSAQGRAGREAAGRLPPRTQVPCDGPDTKLTLRYEAAGRGGALHKALKALDQLQDARFAAESEADEPDVIALADAPPEPLPSIAPNEAETPQEPQPSAAPETSCDTSTDTDTDVVKGVAEAAGAGSPTPCGSCPAARHCPSHCGLPIVTIVTPARADSPPA